MQNRIKSFLWRSAMMTVAFLVATLSENLDILELSPTVTMVLGLILGEVSKYLNSKK